MTFNCAVEQLCSVTFLSDFTERKPEIERCCGIFSHMNACWCAVHESAEKQVCGKVSTHTRSTMFQERERECTGLPFREHGKMPSLTICVKKSLKYIHLANHSNLAPATKKSVVVWKNSILHSSPLMFASLFSCLRRCKQKSRVLRSFSPTSSLLHLTEARLPPTQHRVWSVLSRPLWLCDHRMCVIANETEQSPVSFSTRVFRSARRHLHRITHICTCKFSGANGRLLYQELI